MQPSFANLRWLHIRLRLAGFRMRRLRETNAPAGLGKDAKAFEIGAPEHWGRYLKRLDERLMSPDAYSVAPVARTIAGVVTYGLNQLDPVAVEPDIAASGQCPDGMMGAGLAAPTHGGSDFIERWADAIGKEMGAEEVEKFALTLGEAHHGDITK